jgi:hypothetical protein
MRVLKLILPLAVARARRSSSPGNKAEFKKVADGVYAFVGKRNDANDPCLIKSCQKGLRARRRALGRRDHILRHHPKRAGDPAATQEMGKHNEDERQMVGGLQSFASHRASRQHCRISASCRALWYQP